MVVVLEKLVAKGRRVHHARDQREVAFGLAALSTKKEILVNILKKGGVRTLAHLLKSSSDVEAQRFTALALANTACIGNFKLDFVSEDECLDGILSQLRNDDSDLAVRQYCAMAICNLTADFETHDNICARGGPFALTYFLKAVAEEKDVEAGIYVTLAMSNLAMNPNHRRKFIQYGAIESLVHIACWDDWNVKCKALMALRSICMSYELRAVVLKAGVIDPLVIISRSENKSVLREVAAMFHCLSTVAEKKNEISDRALSTITSLFFQHDYVIERHASSTIANLTEDNAMHQRFLMESGLDHILALYKICHVDAKVQVMRSLSNLSRNKALHSHLLSTHILRAAVEALGTLEMNCQKFSAAFFANLTVDPASHALIIHEGAICPLVHNIMMIGEDIVSVEAKRYAALTLANISSTTDSHEIIVQAQGIEAMLSLSKSADYLSQKNVACTFANFASNTNIHFNIVKRGIIQSITYLGQNKDLDIHLHLTAALRGMSVNTNISVKIVQEGGLKILLPLLLSNNALVLRDTTACLYNLSLTTENKLEILQVGCIPLLKRLIEYDDSEVSGNSCACLTNFAEISNYQFSIASEGGIKASIIAMRSKFLELQRKSGRLFSLLCACNSNEILNEIIEHEGHRFLISFLTSHDSYVIHSGVLGILNLSSYKEYSANIGKTDLLGLLLNIIRSEDLNSELRKMAMMSVVNLSDNINNHLAFVKEGMIDAMTSIYNSPAKQMRTYAALVVANIAKNMNMSQVVTNCPGGIESILHLARINHSHFHRNVLGAIASLSFIKKNNEQICFQGGIKPLLEYFQAESKDSISFNAFCCAIANLSEHVECNNFLTELGIVPPLINVLTKYELENVDEAIRALGNLAMNRHLCLDILQSSNIIPKVLRVLNSGNESSVRMAYMMMTNLAANVKIHDHLLRVDIMSPIAHYLKIALNHPKLKDSDETISYVLLLVANLWANEDNHDMTAKNVVDLVVRYTKHRDVRCRQNAVICLGNLCSRPSTVKRFRMTEIPKIFISFAYTPCHNETFYAQFQAIAGIRGLAFHHDFRTKLVREGCSEPLVLTLTRFRDEGANLPLSREASAAIFNLTLSSDTYLLLVQSGIVSGLSNLIELRDTIAQPYAIGSLANLARNGYHEKLSLFDEITPHMFHNTVTSCWLSDETKKELARCLVHFSRDVRCRHLFEWDYELLEYTLTNLITKDEMVSCQTHSLLSYANLVKNIEVNHSSSLPTILNNLNVLVVATKNHWISRCVAFALNIICQRTITHNSCEKYGVAYLLVKILSLEDEISNWYACIALKHFSAHAKGATKFVEGGGLVYLFVILNTAELEVRVEVLSCLRNLSIPEVNKLHVLQKGGLPALLYLMKSPDTEVSYRACSVVANLAESNECLQAIMDAGVMHDLKISLGSDCDEFDCEALRLLSSISSGSMCIHLADSFLLTQLSQFLLSKCKLCTRYACMSIANLLAIDGKTRLRLVEKGLIHSLVSEIRQGQDEKTKKYALIALSNISKAKQLHDILHRSNIIELAHNFLAKNDESFMYSAALCLSNLASNTENHIMLHSAGSMNIIKSLLDDSNRNLKLCALSFVRGASASGVMVKEFFHLDISTHLLRYAEAEDREIQIEAISALCNMSRSGIIGHETKHFFQCIGMKKLVTFLCDGESTFYLFAAIMIGNISSDHELQEVIMSTGALGTILRIINMLDSESRRCMTYALCNLSCSNSNARGKIISSDAGLSSIFSLGNLGNDNDLYISVSTIRELSSFSELRKIIVDNKGLDYLFHVYENHTNPECLNEAADALCLLSLDDDNKVNIVQHKILQQVIQLALIDMNEVSSLSLRTLANCCEIEFLHGRVIKHMDETFFHKLIAGIGADIMELSRFICNISSVSDNQVYLLRTDHVMHIILELLTRDCSVTLTNIAMALLNFSANREIHGNLCVFRDKIVESVFRIFGCNKIGIRAHYFLCVSVGCLLVNHEFHNLFRVSGLTNLLIEFLSNSDVHMKFQATFAFHLFLRKQEGAILPENENLDISLLNAIKGLDPKLSLHGICSLRYLSIEPDHARNIVKNYGLEAITHALYRADGDMQREISHLFCHLSWIPELRCLVFKSDAFGSMIKMLETATPTCNCLTLAALANCLEDSSSLKHAPCIENTAKTILKRMTDGSLCVKCEAHRALANLLSCHEVMASVTSLDLFNIITSADIFGSNHTIQLCITVTLRKLSVVSSFRNFMIHHEEAMKMICDFCCGQNNKDIIIHAGNALKNLSKYRQTRELVARKGGTTAAIGLLKHDCEEINIIAIAVLYHLSFESKIKYLLYKEEIISLVYNLISEASLMDAFSYASLLLSNLAEDDEVSKFMWQENVISALKRLGSLNSTLSAVGVSKCIFFMSMSVNDTTPRNSIHELVNIVRRLLQSESRQVKNNAAAILGNFAEHLHCHEIINQSNILDPLLNLVQTTKDYHDDSLVCCWALSKILIYVEEDSAVYRNLLALLHSLTHCVLSQRNTNETSFGSMVLCNLSAINSTHDKFVRSKWIPILASLLKTTSKHTTEITLKTLCNLSKSEAVRKQFVQINGMEVLFELVKKDTKHYGLVAFILCEIVICEECKKKVLALSGLVHFTITICDSKEPDAVEACWMLFYRMSKDHDYHKYLLDTSVIGAMSEVIENGHERGKIIASMTFCNLAADDALRSTLFNRGAFDFALSFIKKNSCQIVRSYGVLLIANLTYNLHLEYQLYLPKAVTSMLNVLSGDDYIVQRSAIVSLVNISNHSTCLPHDLNADAIKLLRKMGNKNEFKDMLPYISFSFANFTCNRKILDSTGEHSGIEFIVNMIASSDNVYSRWVGISAIKKLTETPSNRERIMICTILDTIMSDCNLNEGFIRNEVSECLLNLSKDCHHRAALAEACMPRLTLLFATADVNILARTCDSLALLTESGYCGCLDMKDHVLSYTAPLLEHGNLIVRRASSKLLSNLLSFDGTKIGCDLLSSLLRMFHDEDCECRRYASSAFRNIALKKESHHLVMKNLIDLLDLTHSNDEETKSNAILSVQTLSVEKINRVHLVERRVIETLTSFISYRDPKIQVAVLSTLENLSSCPSLRSKIMSADLMIKMKILLGAASYELCLKLVRVIGNLSEEHDNCFKMIDVGIVSATFVVSKSKCPIIQENLSLLLVNLSACRDAQLHVYEQGVLECFTNLTYASNSSDLCIQNVSLGIQLLFSNAEVRLAVVKENRIESLMNFISHPRVQYVHCTCVALSLISVDKESRSYLLLTVESVFKLLYQGTIQIQRAAMCVFANLAESIEMHESLVNMSIVKRISNLVATATDSKIVQDISRFLAFISIHDTAKEHILVSELLPYVIKFSRRTDEATQRYSTLVICNLALHPTKKVFCYKDDFMRVLTFLTKCHDLEVERCSFLTLGILGFGVESEYKELISNDGIFNEILKGINQEHIYIKQTSSLALNSILLNNLDSIRRKWLGKDCELLTTLSSLLEVSDGSCVHNAIYAVGSLIEIPQIRHEIVEKGYLSSVSHVLQNTSCVHTKRACGYFYSVIHEYPEYHHYVQNNSKDIGTFVDLLGSPDSQCKSYGVLISILLASNKDLHVALVKRGAVRHLTSIIELEAELYPYAGFALLKLADNFENHIAFSEQGGIRALLKLGAMGRIKDEDNHNTPLSLAKLAFNAIKGFKPVAAATQISSSTSLETHELNIN